MRNRRSAPTESQEPRVSPEDLALLEERLTQKIKDQESRILILSNKLDSLIKKYNAARQPVIPDEFVLGPNEPPRRPAPKD